MKMAAAEALWETEEPPALSLFTIGNEAERKDVFAIRLPAVMSLLACNNLTCEVHGHQRTSRPSTSRLWTGRLCAARGVSYGPSALC